MTVPCPAPPLYTGRAVTKECHPPLPPTGSPESFPFLLVLGFAVLIVGVCAWWAGRVRKYR